MTDRARQLSWIVLAAAVVAIPILITPNLPVGYGWRLPLATAFTTLSAAVTALSFTHFRSSRDPRELFIGTGFAVLAIQTGSFVVARPLLDSSSLISAYTRGTPLSATPSAAWFAGWLVAGCCFALITPPWERRGRPPIRPVLVLASAAGALLAIDAVILAIGPTFTEPRILIPLAGFPDTFGLPDIGGAGTWAMAGAVAALISVTIAAARGLTGRGGMEAWMGGSVAVAIPVIAAVIARPMFGTLLASQTAEVVALAIPGVAFAGLLATQRTETSRMRRATDRAAEITGGRAEIAQMVAHEIRGPVTTIRGLATTSGTHYEQLSDRERREFFSMIEQESDRLLRIADQTSTALKVDAGTLSYQRMPGDLALTVREGVERASTGEHPMELDVERGVKLELDHVRIAEAVRQLVDNAALYSPADAPINVRSRWAGSEAVVEVIDRGPGIRPEDRERVFRKYPGVRPEGFEEVSGTGLGLFIARAHARAHGGDIVIADAPDAGTMLTIVLPVERDPRGDE